MKQTQKLRSFFSLTIILAVFSGILVLFWQGVSNTSQKNAEETRRLAQQSIDRAIINCYAIEGMYPPSFPYLKENYGVQIDEEKYYVDYQVFASNIKPVVQLLERGQAQLEAGT